MLQRLKGTSPVARIRSYALASLIDRSAWVDLLHVDIQGHEFDVIQAGLEASCRSVKRMVVGTHSNSISHQLRELLMRRDWSLEAEEPCQVSRSRGKESLVLDGCQVWRNDRLQAPLNLSDLSKVDDNVARRPAA